MAKPARPYLKFQSYDEMLADVDRLRSDGYTKAGQWDLAMILDHLGKGMNAPWIPQMKVPWPFSLVAQAMIRRMVAKRYYPNIKFPAPKAMQPTPGISIEMAYPAFMTTVEKIKNYPQPIMKNTPFGDVPTELWQQLHLLHGAHHLAFLQSRDKNF